MLNTNNKPAVTWVKVSDFIRSWLEKEHGGGVRIGNHYIVCVAHLPGAKSILRMATEEDRLEPGLSVGSMSDMRHACLSAGLLLDPVTVELIYGVTRDELDAYVPVECPRTCLTRGGVLRKWTEVVRFSREQVAALQRVFRDAFWRGVEDFARDYAKENVGKKYSDVDMIEAFCKDSGTSDIHVAALRREWQRRKKRQSK